MAHIYELKDGVGPSYVGETNASRAASLRAFVSSEAVVLAPPRPEPLVGQPHAGVIWFGRIGIGIGAQELHELSCGDRRRLYSLRRLQKIGAA